MPHLTLMWRASMNQVEEYIKGFEPDTQAILEKIREIVKEEAPDATERICMKMPTFDLNGKWFVHYAAMKNHIGFYPQPSGVEAFKEQLSEYKTSKGAIQFPYNKPIPFDLIRKIVQYRYKESNGLL